MHFGLFLTDNVIKKEGQNDSSRIFWYQASVFLQIFTVLTITENLFKMCLNNKDIYDLMKQEVQR